MKVYAVEVKADIPKGWHLAWFEAISSNEETTKNKIAELQKEDDTFHYLVEHDRVRVTLYNLEPAKGEN